MLKSTCFLLNSKHLLLLKSLRKSSAVCGLLKFNLNKPTTQYRQQLLNATNFTSKTYFHSSTQFYFIKNNNETPATTTSTDKPADERKIISSTPKSPLSDDLKSFLNSVTVDETEKEKQPIVEDKKPSEEGKKGFFASMFSRENSWKITLVFFSSWFGFLVVYVLTNWG